MKWPAFAVAAAGVSVALASCSFEDSWLKYCGYPGRCSSFDEGGAPLQISQGSSRRPLVLTGAYLADAATVTVVTDGGTTPATATITSSAFGQVAFEVTIKDNVPEGTLFRLQVGWERPEIETATSMPLQVTAIHVTSIGDDQDGAGTPSSPYQTLRRAAQVAGFGDTIRLGPGEFEPAYEMPGTPCDLTSGIQTGVNVEGAGATNTTVAGTLASQSCGFNLTGGGQRVKGLTISKFGEGVRVSSSGAIASIEDVVITECDAGVVGLTASTFQLLQPNLQGNELGLVCIGCDATSKGGFIQNSRLNGVVMTGSGGHLVLTGTDVRGNGSGLANGQDGGGILLTGDGAELTLDGGLSDNNVRTAVTVAGTSNQVTFQNGSLLTGGADVTVALLVKDSSASVFLRDTTLNAASECIRVEAVGTFNAGTGDGAYGRNVLNCDIGSLGQREVHDAQGNPGADLHFAATSFHGITPDAGTQVDAGTNATLSIQIDNPGNKVVFH